MYKSRTQIVTFSELWEEIKQKIPGYFDFKKPDQFITEDFGTIYRNSITFTLEKIGVRSKRHNKFIELVFHRDRLIKSANQFNIPVQLNFDDKLEKNNDEGYEGYEGFNRMTGPNNDSDHKNPSPNKEFLDSSDAQINTGMIDKALDNEVDQIKKSETPTCSLQNPSQHTQHSLPDWIRDKIKENIYKVGNTDLWQCKKCSLSGDKWFMLVHPCKGM
jgi:hypothetical protein